MKIEKKMNIDKAIKKIKKLEKRFLARRYDGRGKNSYIIKKGKIPIMISAPHAVNHFREGKVKYADMLTGGIARYLQKMTGCHLIYSAKQINKDPNFDEEADSEYKKELKKYITNNNIKVVIELHGASKEREYAVEMGTIDESDKSLHEHTFISALIKNYFEYFFKQLDGKKDIWKNKIFDASYKNTITNYISSNTDTACIQLEINGEYRNLENKDKVIKLIIAIRAVIDVLANLDWNSDKIKVYKAAQSAEHIPQDTIQVTIDEESDKNDLKSDMNIALMCLGGYTELVRVKKCSKKTEEKNQHLKDEYSKYIYLPNRLIESVFGRAWISNDEYNISIEGKPIIVYEYSRNMKEIGTPLANRIDTVLFSENLYNKLKPLSNKYDYIIYNRYANTRMYIDFFGSNYEDKGRVEEEKIMIPRYYKRLMGYLDYPLKRIQSEEYLSFKMKLQEDPLLDEEIKKIDNYYEYVQNEDYYKLKTDNNENIVYKLKEVQESYFGKYIELLRIPKYKKNKDRIIKKIISIVKWIKRKVLKKYVDYAEVCLQTTWTEETDDKNNVARISINLMNLLGISENDKIEVQYGDKIEKLRVLERSNGDDYFIGIPAPTRKKLSMNCTNGIVKVRRDMGYALQRHSAQQGVTFLGTILAVFQVVPEVNLSIIIIICLFPIMLYWVLTEERVKVK